MCASTTDGMQQFTTQDYEAVQNLNLLRTFKELSHFSLVKLVIIANSNDNNNDNK